MTGVRRRQFLRLATAALIGGRPHPLGAQPVRGGAKPKVVIVGAGFAGAKCALSLRALDPASEISLVDPMSAM